MQLVEKHQRTDGYQEFFFNNNFFSNKNWKPRFYTKTDFFDFFSPRLGKWAYTQVDRMQLSVAYAIMCPHNVYNMCQEVSPYDGFWLLSPYSWMNPFSYAKCESYGKPWKLIRTHANWKQGLRNFALSRAMQYWQNWIFTFYNYGLIVTTKVDSSQSVVTTKYLNSSCTLIELNMEREILDELQLNIYVATQYKFYIVHTQTKFGEIATTLKSKHIDWIHCNQIEFTFLQHHPWSSFMLANDFYISKKFEGFL